MLRHQSASLLRHAKLWQSQARRLHALRTGAEESQDVVTMARLMGEVGNAADPAFNKAMPMRAKTLYTETLANLYAPVDTTDAAGTPVPQASDMSPRRMSDSYCELLLPFSSSPRLLEEHTNATGGIRTGKLMEHLDSLAGAISYKHVLGPGVDYTRDAGFYMVTASVERLDMLERLSPIRDLRLSGQVIATGRSSMEVAVKMDALNADGTQSAILLGRFSMVCRSTKTNKSRDINPLIVETPEEKALAHYGEDIKRRRKASAAKSLDKFPPTLDEARELHSFHLAYGQDYKHPHIEECPVSSDVDRVWIGDTRAENTLLMFPQDRNVHGKIFGGYLMRTAYELGYTTSSLFTRGPLRFLSLDRIAFARPVPLGSILRLTSRIIHSQTDIPDMDIVINVSVTANVVDVHTGAEQTTNEFRFTWGVDAKPGEAKFNRKVVPKTYKEAMLWVEGKRALEEGDEIRRSLTHVNSD